MSFVALLTCIGDFIPVSIEFNCDLVVKSNVYPLKLRWKDIVAALTDCVVTIGERKFGARVSSCVMQFTLSRHKI